MHIVVTGALGHIGSHLIRALPERFPDLDLTLIDNMSTQRYASLFNLPSAARYRFIEGDVMRLALEPLFDGADLVIHLAAITDAAGSFDMREKVERENFGATERVAAACVATGTAMMLSSSTSVYGTQKSLVDENCGAEDLKPQSPYAETKLREEALVAGLAAQGKLRAIIFRFGTIFGTSPGMRFHTAVNKFCWQAVLGQKLTVWRTAYDQVRPYLALEDAGRAIAFALERNLFDGRIYNVVTSNHTVRQVVETIGAKLGAVDVGFVDEKIMNQLSYEVANTRMLAAGFTFIGNLDRGIADTVALLRNMNGAAR